MPVVDENQQEWVFTLYDFDNSGKVTKEVMAILLTCMTLKNPPKQTAQCLKVCVCCLML